jgi:poly(ADP-ribose) glycohydrolase ARH3
MLGKMCGDVLGAAVEGWEHERVLAEYPDGMTRFRDTDRG